MQTINVITEGTEWRIIAELRNSAVLLQKFSNRLACAIDHLDMEKINIEINCITKLISQTQALSATTDKQKDK